MSPTFNFFLKSLSVLALILVAMPIAFLGLLHWQLDATGKAITERHLPSELRSAEEISSEVYDSIGSGLYRVNPETMDQFVSRLRAKKDTVNASGNGEEEAWLPTPLPNKSSLRHLIFPCAGTEHIGLAKEWLSQPALYFKTSGKTDQSLIVVHPERSEVLVCWYFV